MHLSIMWRRFASSGSRADRLLAYVALCAVTAAGVAVLLAMYSRKPADYRPGDTFASVPGLDPMRSATTIALFVSTNCGACQRSGDVLHRLSRRPREFQLIVIGYESEELLRQFVETSAIEADAVISVPFGSIRLAAVPTLALLDRHRVVQSVWVGSQEITESEHRILTFARARR